MPWERLETPFFLFLLKNPIRHSWSDKALNISQNQGASHVLHCTAIAYARPSLQSE